MTSQYPRAKRVATPAAGLRPARAAALAVLALAAACSDMPTNPDSEAELARSPAVSTAVTEEFNGPAFGGWTADTHPLGRGSVRATNVALGGGTAALSLAAGAYDGAEILTAARYGTGTYTARMRTPVAPGSISAFFLYQGVAGGNDEIDIEIFNDGTRRIMFTTWVAGKETNNVTRTLPFDPAAGLHDYAIEWTAKTVKFRVDGVVMQEFKRGIPKSAMFVMANTWWPTWLTGPVLTTPRTFSIDRITIG
ncbi:glycoside hydrolase family 16 protein [Longimicrobium sp.]|uniref:glycoside hydrolase family 16 protein n=1 Tax=Longimicrobium sp. TaxID=2029185 RepID=UPI002E31733B|nr:glycoside hydrolase family 16 protein [Longimicrobium sp.]HEX6038304.1 glycoside hydrolase family 16 protein [Longimicrobium sp.]